MRLPGRPIIRKGGAVVAFVGGGLQPYRRPGIQQKTPARRAAGAMQHPQDQPRKPEIPSLQGPAGSYGTTQEDQAVAPLP